ncbi:MAG: 3'(2'),5'-bisphosphate nucleotidase CysQ [Alphaproteobacteria bacterium]|nr:3'(2'),5'-bisphosphate nucleotidase CysQ [Alphaproteobacteria bacterium]
MQSTKNKEYQDSVIAIALQAGALLMRYFVEGHKVSTKEDNSPVTNADIEANTLISEALQALDATIPVIAEEDETLGDSAARFWLVDPLDGTRAFVAGEPEFTVNIGLIENGVPTFGVIFVPAQSLLYYGTVGQGAYRVKDGGTPEKIHVRARPEDGVTVVKSKSHPSPKTEAFLSTMKVKEMIAGSSSVKFCQVAEAAADIYPRLGRTMEWDTAAGHAILSAAGGKVIVAETGAPLTYGKAGFENPHFIALGY